MNALEAEVLEVDEYEPPPPPPWWKGDGKKGSPYDDSVPTGRPPKDEWEADYYYTETQTRHKAPRGRYGEEYGEYESPGKRPYIDWDGSDDVEEDNEDWDSEDWEDADYEEDYSDYDLPKDQEQEEDPDDSEFLD